LTSLPGGSTKCSRTVSPSTPSKGAVASSRCARTPRGPEPVTDAGRVSLFLHGGGFELASVRSDGELAARLGRASEMRVLFPENRLAPEHPFPAAIDDVLAAWRWLRTGQSLSAS
jgi:acetyl esterase/lipase